MMITMNRKVSARIRSISSALPRIINITVFQIHSLFPSVIAIILLALTVPVFGAEEGQSLDRSFQLHVKPFLKQHCVRCHNEEKRTSGIRLDHLDSSLDDRHLRLWQGIRNQIVSEAMPPDEEVQPTAADRKAIDQWITAAINLARSRPTPKNGGARRLTVAQYRNTLRELLLLEEDLTESLPPDAVSRDGFVNNQETLALSPLLLEAYFQIAEKAIDQSVVDPNSKPTIQHFRLEMGSAINPKPCPDRLILGANSLLLDNSDFVVTQPKLIKPFEFFPFVMRSKFRFIEGYAGNDTVRGWREYDSIYHAVFACMRGSVGYPKGMPYNVVPQGLLLRPSITNDETFQGDDTYGPKANFKISLRELPDNGRFRVTVSAAKYNDGLLLDQGVKARLPIGADSLVCPDPDIRKTLTIKTAGIYQVDVYPSDHEGIPIAVDHSRLSTGLIGAWPLDGVTAGNPVRKTGNGRLEGDARFVNSPFGKAVSLDGAGDSIVVSRDDSMRVGDGDFSVAAWIFPKQLRQAGIVSMGKYNWTHGWYLDMPDSNGAIRIETAGPNNQSNGTVQSPAGTIRPNAWQHVAAVVRRGKGETHLFVNGRLVARGVIGPANLDNPRVDLQLGRIQDGNQFYGQLDEVRLYKRALDQPEIQALVEPGRSLVPRRQPDKLEEVTLFLGERQFAAKWSQPAFLAVRLDAGNLSVRAQASNATRVGRVVLTPLDVTHDLAKRFIAFERRSPRLGLYLGLRRDCGSTLSQVGTSQTVSRESLCRFVFEGAIRNFPSPEVEKENVNYLAGIREIGVRSEYTDGRDMPRLLIRSVEFEGPFYDTWPPASHQNIFIQSKSKGDTPAYAREIIREFGSRAFRRPLTQTEESSLVAVFDKSLKGGSGFRDSIKDALQVILTSPQFLFIIENSGTPDPEPLDEFELASKLSYFLWNGPPDAELLRLASDGSLRKQMDFEVTRMIEDSRFLRFVTEFTSQWLALDKFRVLEPDRGRFPKLSRDMRTQLTREPVQFVQHLIRNNLSVRNLIESDFLLANEVVASYYDLADRTENGFRFEAIPHGRRELGGLLTQAAILAGLSDGRESNPIKRGAWLARRIIAEPPDDPPPNVPALKEETKQLPLRERLERHRNQRGCAECHSKIDPWGVPLEEFDAGGRLKHQPIDARSTLPDKTQVGGVIDLKRHLANDRIDQVAFSLLKHLGTYATGRTLSHNELEFLKRDGVKLRLEGYPMKEMIRYIAKSPIFLEK